MDVVSAAATWVGLFTGIAGIILSIVAIWFTMAVDKRSRETTNQTIGSMQKIEGLVDRTSTDVGGLIRAAWDRMLGTVQGSNAGASDPDATRAIAAGLAAELRAELLGSGEQSDDEPQQSDVPAEAGEVEASGGANGTSARERPADQGRDQQLDRIEQLDRAIRRLENSLEAQLRPDGGTAVDPVSLMRSLSPVALGLLRALAEHQAHLERDEYIKLRRQFPFRGALNELREAGLVVPLAGGGDEPVYWIPGRALGVVGAGLLTVPPEPLEIKNRVRRALIAVGYIPRVAALYQRLSADDSDTAERDAGSEGAPQARS